jgi:hypothetical protein
LVVNLLILNVILNQIAKTSCHKPARHSWSLFMAGGSTNAQNITKKRNQVAISEPKSQLSFGIKLLFYSFRSLEKTTSLFSIASIQTSFGLI